MNSFVTDWENCKAYNGLWTTFHFKDNNFKPSSEMLFNLLYFLIKLTENVLLQREAEVK